MKIGDNFQAGIKNGVILCAFVSSSVRSSVLLSVLFLPPLFAGSQVCRLMNKLQPGLCPKVNTTSTLAFKEVGV